MPIELKRGSLPLIIAADLVETSLEDIVICATSKYFPPKTSLIWHNGNIYCIVYRWIERPEPKIYVFEACKAPFPTYKENVEIRTPTPISIALVRAKGMDLATIKELER